MNAMTSASIQPVGLAGERLERRLEELLHQDRFSPPRRFEGRTLGDVTTLRDPTVMAELERKSAAEQAQEK